MKKYNQIIRREIVHCQAKYTEKYYIYNMQVIWSKLKFYDPRGPANGYVDGSNGSSLRLLPLSSANFNLCAKFDFALPLITGVKLSAQVLICPLAETGGPTLT